MSSAHNNPANFANRPKEEVREIAAMGGHASHGGKPQPPPAGGGNPGNFANRPKEEVQEIASKGGQASHSGGFASMDPDKQREIASHGGQASSGSFEEGSEKAREAGRKGGLSS
ncbi:hypothetical protein MGN70_004617 [Eutypa lata]|uniref:Putative conidiation-specific protein 10 protein n=1 Tax=Eutypa lata (strain UCR-EL1) TaxID=1287681 RepID=M7T4L7_EUTLA|nr:putative conidiation-specific protein 10 protein [Eutypa lata UCREL1]KAI1254221.1 hypothetical protein MGN70_004617 [Eutypa lata]